MSIVYASQNVSKVKNPINKNKTHDVNFIWILQIRAIPMTHSAMIANIDSVIAKGDIKSKPKEIRYSSIFKAKPKGSTPLT